MSMFANNLASAAFSSSLLRLTGRGEKQNWENIAADAFGNALGQSSVDWLKNITTQSPPANPPATESPAANSTANAEPKTNTTDKAVRENLVKGDATSAIAAKDGKELEHAVVQQSAPEGGATVDSGVEEIVVTGTRMSYAEQNLYDIFHPEIYLDKNYKKPGADFRFYDAKPSVPVQLSRLSFSSFLEPLRDPIGYTDSIVGAKGLLTESKLEFSRNLSTITLLENQNAAKILKVGGALTFTATTMISLSDAASIIESKNYTDLLKPIVDISFGVAGTFGGLSGASGAVSYSAMSYVMQTEMAEKYFTIPMVDLIWDFNHIPTTIFNPKTELVPVGALQKNRFTW